MDQSRIRPSAPKLNTICSGSSTVAGYLTVFDSACDGQD